MEKENSLSIEEKKTGEGKGGKYLEKDDIFFCSGREKRRRKIYFLAEEKKNGEGKGGNYLEKEINGDANQPTNRPTVYFVNRQIDGRH